MKNKRKRKAIADEQEGVVETKKNELKTKRSKKKNHRAIYTEIKRKMFKNRL